MSTSRHFNPIAGKTLLSGHPLYRPPLKTAYFHAGFAADLSKQDAEFLYASQGPIFGRCFTAPVETAAWKVKPSYGVVPTEDRAINPELRNMYKRSRTAITELKGSHLVFISKPVPVANVIIRQLN